MNFVLTAIMGVCLAGSDSKLEAAHSPEVQQILSDWSEQWNSLSSLYAEFDRRTKDEVWREERVEKVFLRYQSADRFRIDTRDGVTNEVFFYLGGREIVHLSKPRNSAFKLISYSVPDNRDNEDVIEQVMRIAAPFVHPRELLDEKRFRVELSKPGKYHARLGATSANKRSQDWVEIELDPGEPIPRRWVIHEPSNRTVEYTRTRWSADVEIPSFHFEYGVPEKAPRTFAGRWMGYWPMLGGDE
jgi:hypothetical protein